MNSKRRYDRKLFSDEEIEKFVELQKVLNLNENDKMLRGIKYV